MYKKLVVSMILFLVVFATQVSAASPFKDVAPSHWAYSDINKAVQKEYFIGYEDGTFRPSNNVSRAESLALIIRVLGLEEDASYYSFSDTEASWAHGAIGTALKHGIVSKSDYGNHFKPNTPATRAELAKWLSNGLLYNDNEYAHVISATKNTILPIREFYTNGVQSKDVPYIAVMMGTGLMRGYENTTWRPKANTTRAEVAAILLRLESAMQKKPTDFFHLRELVEVGEKGTNLETVATTYEYVNGKSFDKVRNKKVSLNLGGGYVQIHHLIFIDGAPKAGNPKSIYTDMFIGPNFYYPNKERDYAIFVHQTVTPTIPVDTNEKASKFFDLYQNGSGFNSYVGLSRFSHGYEKQFGLNIIGVSFHKEFIGKKSVTLWGEGALSEKQISSFRSIITDDGSEMAIRSRK